MHPHPRMQRERKAAANVLEVWILLPGRIPWQVQVAVWTSLDHAQLLAPIEHVPACAGHLSTPLHTDSA